jgi:helix-turn-helix protein
MHVRQASAVTRRHRGFVVTAIANRSEENFAMKLWLNVAEAAEYAGVSRDTIYTACERREIRASACWWTTGHSPETGMD